MRSFIVTNVLAHAHAGDEPVKQARALALISGLRAEGKGIVSTHVLQEYVNVALRKLGLPHGLVRERLAFYRHFEVVPATPDLVAGALDLHVLHQLPFYDALIVQAAASSGCHRLMTEDMQHDAAVTGVRIVNPLLEAA